MKAILYFLAVLLLSHVSYGTNSYEEYEEGASDESSNSDKDIVTSSYILPKQIFNDGKPFYLEKDPVSGILDFNSKKSSGIGSAPTIINPQTDKDISLNTNSIHTPNFHDFLNLPVKYSSSKFVYPLVSSSYANLKYQGNNKNFISNHKNYSTTTTTSPKYYTVPTKFYTPDATKATSQLQSEMHSTAGTESTNPPTRPQPVTTIATTTSTTITTTPTTKATQATTTPKPLFTREPSKYTTTKYKYSTIRKRPLSTTTTESLNDIHSTTPVTTFSPTTTTTFSPTILTTPSSTTINIIQRPATIHSQFRPLPTLGTTATSTIQYSTRSPGDVYSSMSNKKDPNDMSLSELFNSLLDDEMPESSNSQQYDSFSESSVEIETRKPILQNGSFVGVIEENIGNDYVKYEVQKPNINVAQYKPVSSMNNIVISPDQDSASFVLGSQQSVGTHYLGTDAKKPAVSNQAGTNDFKYGTYYNEDNYQSMKPQGFVMTRTTEKTTTVANEAESAKPINSGFSFPVDKFENAPIVTGTFKSDFIAPIALPQTGSGHIVFPPNSETVQATVNAQHLAASNADFLDSTNLVSFQETKDKPNHIQSENVNSNQVISLHQVQKNQQQQLQGPHTLQFTQQQQQQEFVQPQNQQQYESPLQQQFIQSQHQFNQPQPQQPPPQFVQLQNSHTPFPYPQQQIQQQQQQQLQIQQQQIQQQQTNEPNRPQTLQPNRHQEGSNIQTNYPTISNDLTPPEESNNHPQQQFSEISHRPPITRPPQHFGHNDLTRNPLPGVHRPINNDRPLPNILPQFRPNAKIGQGHPHNKDASNVRMGQPPFGARLPQTQQRIQHTNQNGRPNPSFRRPPSSANAFNSKMAGPPQPPTPEQMDQNRRYFQVRPSQNERIYNYPPQHYIDGIPAQRHSGIDIAEPKSDTQLPIYENNEFQRNIPRRSVGQMPDRIEERGKLEPVVTLQMIQYQKLLQKDASKSNLNTVPHNKNPDAPVSVHTASDKPPVYVVYPVKTSPMKLDGVGQKETDPVVVGQRGEQSPVPPSEINSIGAGNEYQNTPFTVIRQEQEPILMVKQKNNPQGNKQQFPYPLERPENGLDANGQIYFKKEPFYGNNGVYNLGEEPVDAQGRVVNKGTFNLNRNNDEKISSKLTRYVH